MGQKLNSGIGKQQQQQQQSSLQPPPTLNSLVGSTSLFNYKFLMLDESTQNTTPTSLSRLNVRAINLTPTPTTMAATSPTSYSNRLSSLSTTVSTFSSSTTSDTTTNRSSSPSQFTSIKLVVTDNFVDTATSSTMRSRATSTPKMTTITNDSNYSSDRSRLHLFNRFSTASTMSSISSSTSSPRQSQQPQTEQIVLKKPPQLVKSATTGKERADRRATSKRASFKEKLSRINKRWSVSRLNEATASSGVNSNNDKVKIIR